MLSPERIEELEERIEFLSDGIDNMIKHKQAMITQFDRSIKSLEEQRRILQGWLEPIKPLPGMYDVLGILKED